MKAKLAAKAAPAAALSPVFANPERRLPRVGRRDPVWRLALGGVGVACFSLVVFTSLSHGRLQLPQAQAHVHTPQPAPAPTPVAPTTGSRPSYLGGGTAPAGAADTGAGAAGAPTVLLDLSDQTGSSPPVDPLAVKGPGGSPPGPMDPNASPDERFSDRITAGGVASVRASRLASTALIAPQGTIIPAVLETALNSDLPGFTRAIVSSDVRGYDGSTVLIPKGSKLIGQYKSAVSAGQSRAFVVWTRLLTPDGVSIDLGSPATDEVGRGGVAGETNTHFLRRFSSSILTSVITAGLAIAARGGGASTAIVLSSPAATTGGATAALSRDADIPDTIDVKQGAAIRVFVAKDLDFSSVMGRGAG
jgi:type IV secretion system protein VirB10